MPIWQTVVAGIIGALGMSVLMTIIHRASWANADMIRALGSLATRRYENALLPGLVVHLTSGILFAFPYAILLTLVAPPTFVATASMGAVMGLFHGIVFSFILLAVVRDLHPLEQFRKAGIEVALAHIAGHVGYGLMVGAAIGSLDIRWNIFVHAA